MKKLVLMLMLVVSMVSFSQWEKTASIGGRVMGEPYIITNEEATVEYNHEASIREMDIVVKRTNDNAHIIQFSKFLKDSEKIKGDVHVVMDFGKFGGQVSAVATAYGDYVTFDSYDDENAQAIGSMVALMKAKTECTIILQDNNGNYYVSSVDLMGFTDTYDLMVKSVLKP